MTNLKYLRLRLKKIEARHDALNDVLLENIDARMWVRKQIAELEKLKKRQKKRLT